MKHIKLYEQFNSVVIAYHGTKEPFTEFEQRDGSVSTIFGESKVKRTGFFFAEKPEFAAEFGDHILKCALQVNNWLDLRYGFQLDLIDKLAEMGVSYNYLYQMPVEEIWEIFDGEDASFLLDKIVELGYDGIMMSEEDNNFELQIAYVVLDKNKIEILETL